MATAETAPLESAPAEAGAPLPEPSDRLKGKVKWFNATKVRGAARRAGASRGDGNPATIFAA